MPVKAPEAVALSGVSLDNADSELSIAALLWCRSDIVVALESVRLR
jgi:hypothetical protein